MPYTRPKTVVCANCGNAFPINPIGRVPRHCKPSCRVAFCAKTKHLRPSAEEKLRRTIGAVLLDADIIPPDRPLPPRREDAA